MTGGRDRAGRLRLFRRALVVVLAVSGAGFVAVELLLDAYTIPSDAMAPSIEKGDRILVSSLDRDPGRGDVVVYEYEDPLAGMLPHRLSRVVAVGGDRAEGRGGRLVVNGETVAERYLSTGTSMSDFPAVDVPDGHMFLLGDNRGNAQDSRFLGPLPTDAVEGTVLLTNVPLDWVLSAITVVAAIALVTVVVRGRRSSPAAPTDVVADNAAPEAEPADRT